MAPRREKSFVRWKDRVKEYMHERVADKGMKHARMDMRGGSSSAVVIPSGDVPRWNEASSETIDRYIGR